MCKVGKYVYSSAFVYNSSTQSVDVLKRAVFALLKHLHQELTISAHKHTHLVKVR